MVVNNNLIKLFFKKAYNSFLCYFALVVGKVWFDRIVLWKNGYRKGIKFSLNEFRYPTYFDKQGRILHLMLKKRGFFRVNGVPDLTLISKSHSE